jgi:hypothetical protein
MNHCSHLELPWNDVCLANKFLSLSLSLMLRPTVSRPVCLGIKRPSRAYDQIFITVRQLWVWCGALFLTRERVRRLQLLLALASAVILELESRGTRNHILLSQIRVFAFSRVLRLAGLWWRYSTPPSHGFWMNSCHNQSQSYFTTGCLPPVSRLGARPHEAHDLKLFSNWTLAVIVLM